MWANQPTDERSESARYASTTVSVNDIYLGFQVLPRKLGPSTAAAEPGISFPADYPGQDDDDEDRTKAIVYPSFADREASPA